MVDILMTTNVKGEVVQLRYVVEYQFMGQTIRDCDVGDVTIARGLLP